MKFYSTELENGLRVIAECSPAASSSALGFFVKTGSRDEFSKELGLSHFLEHMLFKGTEKRSALDVSRDLSAIGAQANAFTSEENTVYYASVLPEHFADAFEIIADMMSPKLDKAEFDLERKVILEEISLYRDRPYHVLFEAAMKQYYGENPLGNSVLGSYESISAMEHETMRAYFERRYKTSNMVVAASGNVDWERLVSLASEHCSSWLDAPCPRKVSRHFASQTEVELRSDNTKQCYVCFCAAGPSSSESFRYPMRLVSTVMGAASTSRVHWELIDKGLVESAAIDLDEMEGDGIHYGYLGTSSEKLEEAQAILAGIMDTPLDFSTEDLERAKIKFATSFALEAESPMKRLMTVAFNYLYRGEYLSLQRELELVRSVCMRDVEEALECYPTSPKSLTRLLPGG